MQDNRINEHAVAIGRLQEQNDAAAGQHTRFDDDIRDLRDSRTKAQEWRKTVDASLIRIEAKINSRNGNGSGRRQQAALAGGSATLTTIVYVMLQWLTKL